MLADNALTVQGLIEKLQQFDPDAEVVDTWGRKLLRPLMSIKPAMVLP